MKLSKPLIAVIVVAILVIAGAAIAFAALSNQEKAGENDVRIGYLVGDLHQLSRVVANSDEAGNGTAIFKQYGIDAVYPNPAGYANGPAIITAFAGGDLDAAWIGAPPVILNVLNSDTKVKIVAAANNEGSSIVAKDPAITTIEDLKGKTVGTPGAGSIQHVWLLSLAQAANIPVAQKGTSDDSNTIYWTAVPPVNQKAFLDTDQIDAAVGWEPYGSDSILAGTAHEVLWSGDAPGWENHPCCVLIVSKAFAEEHSDLVDKLVAAHVAANEWIADAEANPTSSNFTTLKTIAGDFSDRNETVVENALNHTVFTYALGDAFKKRLANFTEEFISLGQITEDKIGLRGYSSVEDFVDKLVDPQYLERAKDIQPNR